ncbi:amidohydrolase family protein [Edaphobacter sp. 4G125]|nr:amidohydrolase family protein [Edaphobacter sp. 4G125]
MTGFIFQLWKINFEYDSLEESSVTQRIDAHHHLWRYSVKEYGWIDGSMAALQRDFLPEDLIAAMRSAGVDGTIAVQARQTLEETHWLLELADRHQEICGVAGWAPIASPEFRASLEALVGQPKLKGLRHIVQAEPDENFILREDFNRGIRILHGTGLVYDILIYERHLPQAIAFVDRHPDQVFVLDHIAKPRIGEGALEPWATQIRELAKRENVFCKISGMVTEADWKRWTPEGLRPYLDTVVEAFGPKRLMVGSDWPVCLVACGYAQWFHLLEQYFTGFSVQERDAVFGDNARRVYGI